MPKENNIRVLSDEESDLCHYSTVWVTYDESGIVLRLSNQEILNEGSYQTRLRCGTSAFESTLLKWSSQSLLIHDIEHGGFEVAEKWRVGLISNELTLKKHEVEKTSKGRAPADRYTLKSSAMSALNEEVGA